MPIIGDTERCAECVVLLSVILHSSGMSLIFIYYKAGMNESV